MRRYTLLLLVAAVLLAGCTQLDRGARKQDKPDVIEIEGPTCRIGGTPCSDTKVTKYGGPATVRLTFGNFGEEEVNVSVGPRGRRMLISKCNSQLASLDPAKGGGFSVKRSGPTRLDEWTSGRGETPPKRITLKPDERLTLEWRFEIVPGDGDVSRLGYSCPLAFEARFVQKLNASRQIQIKARQDVSDVSSLDSTQTAKRPVRLKIDAPKRFVAKEGRALLADAYLEDVGKGEVTDVLSIRPVEGSFIADNLKKEDGSRVECTPDDQDLRMFGEGPREGQSYRKSCVIDYGPGDLGSASEIHWLKFTARYRYKLPLGTKTITLQPAGAG